MAFASNRVHRHGVLTRDQIIGAESIFRAVEPVFFLNNVNVPVFVTLLPDVVIKMAEMKEDVKGPVPAAYGTEEAKMYPASAFEDKDLQRRESVSV